MCENAEDAAQDEFFDEAGNVTICEKWKTELKTTEFVAVTSTRADGTEEKTCRDIKTVNSADAIEMRAPQFRKLPPIRVNAPPTTTLSPTGIVMS